MDRFLAPSVAVKKQENPCNSLQIVVLESALRTCYHYGVALTMFILVAGHHAFVALQCLCLKGAGQPLFGLVGIGTGFRYEVQNSMYIFCSVL